MRTTIDINDKLLKEAWAIRHPGSKRELVEWALEEAVRREKLKRLAGWAGKIPMINLQEFLRLRRHG